VKISISTKTAAGALKLTYTARRNFIVKSVYHVVGFLEKLDLEEFKAGISVVTCLKREISFVE